jgi:hypothetical protein
MTSDTIEERFVLTYQDKDEIGEDILLLYDNSVEAGSISYVLTKMNITHGNHHGTLLVFNDEAKAITKLNEIQDELEESPNYLEVKTKTFKALEAEKLNIGGLHQNLLYKNLKELKEEVKNSAVQQLDIFNALTTSKTETGMLEHIGALQNLEENQSKQNDHLRHITKQMVVKKLVVTLT